MNDTTQDPRTPPERLLRLAEVPSLPWLPRRNGRQISIATIHRWAATGLNGRKLPTVRAGGAMVTTETWIREWFRSLADTPVVSPGRRTSSARDRDRALAAAELAEAGI